MYSLWLNQSSEGQCYQCKTEGEKCWSFVSNVFRILWFTIPPLGAVPLFVSKYQSVFSNTVHLESSSTTVSAFKRCLSQSPYAEKQSICRRHHRRPFMMRFENHRAINLLFRSACVSHWVMLYHFVLFHQLPYRLHNSKCRFRSTDPRTKVGHTEVLQWREIFRCLQCN